MMMKFVPTRSRTRRTISTGKRIPLLVGPTPLIGAVVRARRDELVDQITLGPHDLDAVIAGLLRQGCAPDEVLDRPLDLLGRELVGHEGRDRGLDRARAG